MKRILVIAGGEWQVPIIRTAKALGYFVVNTNLYENSPGFVYADVGVVVDVYDVQKNIEVARQYNVDAIVSDQSDIVVGSVAKVSDALQLPNIGVGIAQRFTSKYLMRQMNAQCGFPSPKFAVCTNAEEILAFMQLYATTVVVKPISNQSSRGVIKIEVCDLDLVKEAYEYAKVHTPDGRVIVEEYIGGIELTVDGVKLNDGIHYCLATSFKEHYEHNTMIAKALWFANSHPEIDYAQLHEQHNQLIAQMQLPFGLTHAEYKYYNGKFYLIEVAARGGGTNISSHIVPIMSGIDSVNLLLRMVTGERIQLIHPLHTTDYAVLYFFNYDQGVVRAIYGVDQVTHIPGVISFGMNIVPGQRILSPTDDRSRHAFAIVRGTTYAQVVDCIDQIRSIIRIEYE
jgi:carbamoyl-phosphate synthase large subunit